MASQPLPSSGVEPTQVDLTQKSPFTPQRRPPTTYLGCSRPFEVRGSALIEPSTKRVLIQSPTTGDSQPDMTQGATQAATQTIPESPLIYAIGPDSVSQLNTDQNITAPSDAVPMIHTISDDSASLIPTSILPSKIHTRSGPSLQRKPKGSYYRPILGSTTQMEISDDEKEIFAEEEASLHPVLSSVGDQNHTSPIIEKITPQVDTSIQIVPENRPMPAFELQALQQVQTQDSPGTQLIASQAVSPNEFSSFTQLIPNSPLAHKVQHGAVTPLRNGLTSIPDTQVIADDHSDDLAANLSTSSVRGTPISQFRQRDMFLTPKTYPQLSKIPRIENSPTTPVHDTQVIENGYSSQDPPVLRKLSSVEEAEKENTNGNTQNTDTPESHLRYFRDVEDTQMISSPGGGDSLAPRLISTSQHTTQSSPENNDKPETISNDLPSVSQFFGVDSRQEISSSIIGEDEGNASIAFSKLRDENNKFSLQEQSQPANQNTQLIHSTLSTENMSSQLSNIEVPATAEQKSEEDDIETEDIAPEEGKKNSEEVSLSNEVLRSQYKITHGASQRSKSFQDVSETPDSNVQRALRHETFNTFSTPGEDEDEVITSDYEEDKGSTHGGQAINISKLPVNVFAGMNDRSKRFPRRIFMDEEEEEEYTPNSSVRATDNELKDASNKRRQSKNDKEGEGELRAKRAKVHEACWPSWGQISKAGGRGVWAQWRERFLVGCLIGGKETGWPLLNSKEISIELLLKKQMRLHRKRAGQELVDILFSDGNVGERSTKKVTMLDLQLGDVVKINSNRKIPFEIIELVNSKEISMEDMKLRLEIAATAAGTTWTLVEPEENAMRISDLGGHDYAIVRGHMPGSSNRVGGRRSSSGVAGNATLTPGSSQGTSDSIYAVPLTDFYMPKSQWKLYLGRRNKVKSKVSGVPLDKEVNSVPQEGETVNSEQQTVTAEVTAEVETPSDKIRGAKVLQTQENKHKGTDTVEDADKSGITLRRKSSRVKKGIYYESSQEDDITSDYEYDRYISKANENEEESENENEKENQEQVPGMTKLPGTVGGGVVVGSVRKKVNPSSDIGCLSKMHAGIFSGCVFSLTKVVGESRWIQQITRNGGVVLKDGFEQMVRLEGETGPLGWQEGAIASGYKFAAVLGKEAMRTRKYLEALALGWPCLSWQYIQDCLDDPDVVGEWEHYLLSAGSSSALGEVQMSLNLSQFINGWQQGFQLGEQFEKRRRIFGCIRVPVFLIEHETLSEVILGTGGSGGGGSMGSIMSNSVSSGNGMVLKPRSNAAIALSKTFRILLLMMGFDCELINIVRDTKELEELQAQDEVEESGIIVIHNCECSLWGNGGSGGGGGYGGSSSQRRSGSGGGELSGLGAGVGATAGTGRSQYRKVTARLDCTEDKALLRKLHHGVGIQKVMQYHREWIIQSLINGRVV